MATEADLLRAIYAAPKDDGPRLVYGDCLQAKGDPHGELIQMQCRLADASLALTVGERRKLRAAENKLLKTLMPIFEAPVVALAESENDPFKEVKVVLRRGFVASVRVPARVLQKLPQLFAIAPLTTELQVIANPASGFKQEEIAASDLSSPLLSNLESLRFCAPSLGDETMRVIAGCTHLGNLRELAITDTRWLDIIQPIFTVKGARALAASPHLANVRSLGVEDNRLGDAGIEALIADSAPWKHLESLNISVNECTGEVIDVIAKADVLRDLKRLAMRFTGEITPAQAAKLASAPSLKSLRALDIEKCQIGAKGAEAFFKALDLPNLEELIIASNSLGDAGSVALATSPGVANLRVLDITKNRIGKKAIKAIASSPHLAKLAKILINDRENDEARQLLIDSETLASTQIYYRGHVLAREGDATTTKKAKKNKKKTDA